jgi:5'-nucleotidase
MAIILLTNDDGVGATGLKALREAIGPLGDIYTVAPDGERSACAHSLTIHTPLRINRLDEKVYSITGTPTDCVAIAVNKLLPNRPELIISGINHGPNLGDDITYSGTVSAAMEGIILNTPSFAISLNRYGGEGHLETAGNVARTLAEDVLQHSLPFDTFLNVNVPNLPLDEIKGFRLTRQGSRAYDGAINETRSPWGELYYWIGGGTAYWEHGEDTDMHALREGYVSITPLHLDMTNYRMIEFLKRQWKKRITDD